MKKKIIIDMDIGDDIDDAIALYAAMRQEFEIIGITTVFRNTTQRARMAKKLLKEYAHGYENVPVYVGYGEPISKGEWDVHASIPHYTPDLDDDSFTPDGNSPEEAIDFIIESCKRYGKELTVAAIGPFTNIAKVIEKDEDALRQISSVVIMGGAFYKQYADWNVICDVKAADIMFRKLSNLVCIGADVTHRMLSEPELYDNLLNYTGDEKGHAYLTKLCGLWRKDRPRAKLLLHDALVIYAIADPTLCVMNPASVILITEGCARGMTFNVDAYGKKRYNPEFYAGFDCERKILVASDVDRDTFNARIFGDFNV